MIKVLLLLCISIVIYTPYAEAKVSSAKLAVDIPAGQWKATRIKNLPKHAVVKVEIKGDAEIDVFLINQDSYDKYPDMSRPLFESRDVKKISFSVKIPASGNYYLLFDNSSSTGEVKLEASITGASGSDAVLLQEGTLNEQDTSIERSLSKITTELNRLFIFEPFPISIKTCGKEEAFSNSDGVTLCAEFARKIVKSVGSKEKAINVLLFTIFHEVGHILLNQWGYPFFDNEDIADEFATTMLIMLSQKERLGAVTEFFISNPSSNELMAKALKGDRHQLSIQRARNILAWQKDVKRFRQWQNIFVPHMQTEVLEKLKKTKPSWTNSELIEQQLSLRNK